MKTKILLVEDEEDTAALLKTVLEREGFSVIQAKDGRQANTLIETIRPPSLVLLDLVLPYVSGSELLKIIRQHPDWQRTPIIVISADSHQPDIERTLGNGATAYVLKQKGSKVLLEEVRNLLPPSLHTTPASNQPVKKEAHKAPRNQRPPARRQPRSGHGKKRGA